MGTLEESERTTEQPAPTQAQAQPASAQAQPASAPAQSASAQTQPTSAQAQLASTEAQPTSAEAQPASAPAQPASAQTQSASAQTQSASAQTQPASAQARPASAQARPASAQAQPVRRINAAPALSGRTSVIVRGQLRPPKSGHIEPPTKAPSLTTFTADQTVAALAQYESIFEQPQQEENQGLLGSDKTGHMELPEWQKFQGVIARARARALQKHALVDKSSDEDYQGSLLDKIQALKSKIERHVTGQESGAQAIKSMGESLQQGNLDDLASERAASIDLMEQANQFERSADRLVQAVERDLSQSHSIPDPVNPMASSVEIPLTDPHVLAAMQPLRCPDLDPGKSRALGSPYLQPPKLQDSPIPYSEVPGAQSVGDMPAGAMSADAPAYGAQMSGAPAEAADEVVQDERTTHSYDELMVTAADFSHDGPVPEGTSPELALAQALESEALRPYQVVSSVPDDSGPLSELMGEAAAEDDEQAQAEVRPHGLNRGGYLPCYVIYDFAQDRFLLDEGSCRLLGMTYTGDWIPHALLEMQIELIDHDAMLNILFNPEAGDSIFSHVRIKQGTHQGERLFFTGSVVKRDDTGIALLVSGFFARIQADFLECLAKIKNHSSSFDIDAYTGEIHFGAAIYQLLGLKPGDSLPRSLIEFEKRYIHPDDLLIYRKQGDVVSNPSLGDYYESIYRLKHSGGYYIWCIDRGLVVERKRSGKASRIIGTTTNIDVVRSNFERLKRTIYQDPLTGLHNRLYLNTRNKFFTMEESQPLSLVYVDISGLKVINDYLGHAKGDALVKLAVTVLSQDIFLDHEVVRLSGDEFLLIFPCCSQAQCAAQMERFVADLNFRNAAHEFPLPVFIGYGIATLNEIDDGDTFMRCEQRADERLKRYKQQHHDEIYDALRSFIEEMLGHSIDLTDNRVLDYINQQHKGSPKQNAPLSQNAACTVAPNADLNNGGASTTPYVAAFVAARPMTVVSATEPVDSAAESAATTGEPNAPVAGDREPTVSVEGYQVFTGSTGSEGSAVPLQRQYPNSAFFTTARLSEKGEHDD